MRARGFLLGATAGRTTLNGEGLQHEDGHSHLLARPIPNCAPTTRPSPTSRGDHPGRHARMYAEQETIFYYITLMNENYAHAGHAGRARARASSRACTCCRIGQGRRGQEARATCWAGHDPARGARRGRDAREGLRRPADVWSVTSASRNCAATALDASAGTCCTRTQDPAQARTSRSCWKAAGPRHRGHRLREALPTRSAQVGAPARYTSSAPTASAAATPAPTAPTSSRSTPRSHRAFDPVDADGAAVRRDDRECAGEGPRVRDRRRGGLGGGMERAAVRTPCW
jgi:hypothetical protein